MRKTASITICTLVAAALFTLSPKRANMPDPRFEGLNAKYADIATLAAFDKYREGYFQEIKEKSQDILDLRQNSLVTRELLVKELYKTADFYVDLVLDFEDSGRKDLADLNREMVRRTRYFIALIEVRGLGEYLKEIGIEGRVAPEKKAGITI